MNRGALLLSAESLLCASDLMIGNPLIYFRNADSHFGVWHEGLQRDGSGQSMLALDGGAGVQ